MELDDLKQLWKENNEKLESKIQLNEKLLREMNMDKAIVEFDRLLKLSLWGRNLALVYCIFSFIMASQMVEELKFSIPAIIGGLTMLWSFVHHLAIDKPDYNSISVVELQKSIYNFRIHSINSAKYDGWVSILWLLTMSPLFFRLYDNTDIYSNLKYLSVFCLISFVVIVLLIVLGKKVYQDYERKLKKSESYLEEIKEFERG